MCPYSGRDLPTNALHNLTAKTGCATGLPGLGVTVLMATLWLKSVYEHSTC